MKTQNHKASTIIKIIEKSTPNVLYNCREHSTNRSIFLQNKANFKNDQMDINLNISSDYEEKLHWTLGENKPNQSQLCSVEKIFYKLIIMS